MADVFEEAAECQLWQFGLAVWLHHLADGHACTPQPFDDLIACALCAPVGEVLVDEVVMFAAPGGGRQRRIHRPFGLADRIA